jgi:hypothetical protein
MGWPKAMAWVGLGAGCAGHGGGVSRMPRGKLGYLWTGRKEKGIGVVLIFLCLSYECF